MRAMLAALVLALLAGCGGSSSSGSSTAEQRLTDALGAIVTRPDGPPGIVAVVQRGAERAVYTAGVADLSSGAPIDVGDRMRLASVAKAFSGAAALAVVSAGGLALDDTVGKWLPGLPVEWADITLTQLLNHTSGIPDFSLEDAFLEALVASLLVAPPPVELLGFIEDPEPDFPPGSRYRYSNSDNIIVGLMVAAASGEAYEDVLRTRVYAPLGLAATSLPAGAALPTPRLTGYDIDPPAAPEDVTELFAAGWTWASGGVVSTPADATRFVRGWVGGALVDAPTRAAQFTFVRGGSSEPPGPGTNDAGLALFRYRTRCGTVYGHTGNTPGYTQFIAASEDGTRSVTVSINSQLTPQRNEERFRELRRIYEHGVCAALS
jgi:D-alanyl-D-alanine carboxypeptidase